MASSRLKDPRLGFEETVEKIEIRTDPLTGKKSRINIKRATRPKEGSKIRLKFTRKGCPFCPENIMKVTPKFPEGFPERITYGESVVFPNLFPFGEFHAVGVFSKKHHIPLNKFSPKLIENCFRACLKTLEKASEQSPRLRYWQVNWNYLQPAGASIVHPHLQILADSEPTAFLNELMNKSAAYFRRYQKNYWSELISAERKIGARYIGRLGNVHWLASFAPLENKEIVAIVENISSLSQMKNLKDLCCGISRLLKWFEANGIGSFNLSSYSGPCDQPLNHYWLHFRVIARPPPVSLYTNDSGFMERMHMEPVVDTLPEPLAEELRGYF